MSGIAGIIHFDGRPALDAQIQGMTAAISHRGPDETGHWIDGCTSLGHCMLRTTPESFEEQQPLHSEDHALVLVMDGRVDNWQELRRTLKAKGSKLRNRSDAELVLHAFQIWEKSCVNHIEGDFAFAIWDRRQRSLFCARDRMSVKPFVYHWNGKMLAFASELRAILSLPWVPSEPNEGILAEFLAAEHYSCDETLWRDILRLPGSHRMTVAARGPRLEKYWSPEPDDSLTFATDEEYADCYKELFFESVRRLSRSHAPVAFEVSGGLDSSAVFCTAEHLRRSNKLPNPGIQGYSLAFPGDPGADELEFSRGVGEYLGLEITEVPPMLAGREWFEEQAQRYRDFPGYPNGAMSVGLRRSAQQQGCRVILTGIGGDQWFGGSSRRLYYAEELASGRLLRLADCFSADWKDFGPSVATQWFLKFGLMPLLPQPVADAARSARRIFRRQTANFPPPGRAWLSHRMQLALKAGIAKSNAPIAPANWRFGARDKIALAEDAWSVRAAEWEERIGSGVGIESRHPMISPSMIRLALSVPERLHVRGRTRKVMHRQAMEGVLPRSILERRTKAEFSSVFQRHLEHMQRELTLELPSKHPDWVNAEEISRVYSDYLTGITGQAPAMGGKLQWVLWNLAACGIVFN